MTTKLAKSELRDLIMDFYTTHDAQRLEDGIDINGMVEWTMDKGLEALNNMLASTYGAQIDPNSSNDMNTAAGVARASMALTPNMVDIERAQKEEIRTRLVGFYEKHDPGKINKLEKLIAYAMYKGESALNTKLRDKYGEDMTDYDRPEPSYPSPAEEPLKPPLAVHPSVKYDIHKTKPAESKPKEDDLPPPPPFKEIEPPIEEPPIPPKDIEHVKDPPPAPVEIKPVAQDPPPPVNLEKSFIEEIAISDDELQEELEQFYMFHDPSKLAAVDHLVKWAARIGRDKFNKKLVQIYGYSLDDPFPKPKLKQEVAPEPSPAPVVTKKPVVTQKPVVTEKPKEVSQVDKDIETLNKFEQSPGPAQPVSAPPSPPPSISYPKTRGRLAIVSTDGSNQPKNSFVSFEQARNMSHKAAKPTEGPKLVKAVVKTGACDNYRLDMTSKYFGYCVCGFPRSAHAGY